MEGGSEGKRLEKTRECVPLNVLLALAGQLTVVQGTL